MNDIIAHNLAMMTGRGELYLPAVLEESAVFPVAGKSFIHPARFSHDASGRIGSFRWKTGEELQFFGRSYYDGIMNIFIEVSYLGNCKRGIGRYGVAEVILPSETPSQAFQALEETARRLNRLKCLDGLEVKITPLLSESC